MIRLPPRSTQSRSSAASDVYKRQGLGILFEKQNVAFMVGVAFGIAAAANFPVLILSMLSLIHISEPHETVLDLVCRLLLEKKKINGRVQTTWCVLHGISKVFRL
mgnify:CR=1 FL=1